jgi:ATP-dependent helicase/DNAse subunit B
MNRNLQQLAIICKEKPLQEKWVIVPNYRMGNQLIDYLVSSGEVVVNLRLRTIKSIVIDFYNQLSDGKPYRMMNPLIGSILVGNIWHQLAKEGHSYLCSLPASQELFQHIFQSIQTIRLSNNLPPKLDNPKKSAEFHRFYQEYEAIRKKMVYIDYPDMLKTVLSKGLAVSKDIPIVIDDEIQSWGLEKQFLEQLAKHTTTVWNRDKEEPTQSPQTNLELLQWHSQLSKAPDRLDDNTVQIGHTVGECNEIRNLFRQCLEKEIPFDHVEILYSDRNTYASLIYELSKELNIFPPDTSECPTYPITFAEGLPISISKPIRALMGWIEWMKDGYSQKAIARLLDEQLICSTELKQSDIGNIVTVFRSLKIGFGRERYTNTVTTEIKAIKKNIESKSRMESTLSEDSKIQTDLLHRKLGTVNQIHHFINTLFSITPKESSKPDEILQCVESFLLQYTIHHADEFSNYSRKYIIDQISLLRSGLGALPNSHVDVWDVLKGLIQQSRVLGSGPRPGYIHAASISDGGYSGRKYTFLLGMDDQRFPGRGQQDSILLDTEREQISKEIPTSKTRIRHKFEQFDRLLKRLDGEVFFSYSSKSVLDERERFPGTVLLNIYRLISGHRDGNLNTMIGWLNEPQSFSPSSVRQSLTEKEWWMKRLQEPELRDDVVEQYPHIGQGRNAIELRMSDRFTEYDGYVQTAGKFLDPSIQQNDIRLSATMLETLGSCPLRFFFRYGLSIKLPDELELDKTTWLDPMSRGSLLHELFEDFMKICIDEERAPGSASDETRILELLDTLISRYVGLIPPPNESVFEREKNDLEQCARIFLCEEELHSKDFSPYLLEQKVTEEISIQGSSFQGYGIVDRIDCVGESDSQQFAVWDYKTGGKSKYENLDLYDSGRVIQHVLYIELCTRYLKRQNPQNELLSFGFFFPNTKERGARIMWKANELTEGLNVIAQLCESIRHGAFIATDKKKDCRFCDYLPICRDTNTVNSNSKKKIQNEITNPSLQFIQALRKNDKDK